MLSISYNEDSITADICKIIEAIEFPVDESISIVMEDSFWFSDMVAEYRKGKRV